MFVHCHFQINNCTKRPPTTYCSQDTSGAFKIQIKDNYTTNSTANAKFRMKVFGKLVTNCEFICYQCRILIILS
jgi:uncharacterized protein YdeI (BOF family)